LKNQRSRATATRSLLLFLALGVIVCRVPQHAPTLCCDQLRPQGPPFALPRRPIALWTAPPRAGGGEGDGPSGSRRHGAAACCIRRVPPRGPRFAEAQSTVLPRRTAWCRPRDARERLMRFTLNPGAALTEFFVSRFPPAHARWIRSLTARARRHPRLLQGRGRGAHAPDAAAASTWAGAWSGLQYDPLTFVRTSSPADLSKYAHADLPVIAPPEVACLNTSNRRPPAGSRLSAARANIRALSVACQARTSPRGW